MVILDIKIIRLCLLFLDVNEIKKDWINDLEDGNVFTDNTPKARSVGKEKEIHTINIRKIYRIQI